MKTDRAITDSTVHGRRWRRIAPDNSANVVCRRGRHRWLKPTLLTALVGALLLGLSGSVVAAGAFTITPLTNDSEDDKSPQISGDRIVWAATGGTGSVTTDYEIFTWTLAGGIEQITDNDDHEGNPQVSGDRVVWWGEGGTGSVTTDYEIFTWTPGGGVVQITDNGDDDDEVQVSGDRVVWVGEGGSDTGSDTEIFTWTPSSDIVQLDANSVTDFTPQVSGDRVVWVHWDGDWEIMLWTAGDSSSTQVTNDSTALHDLQVQISGDRLVWRRWDTSDQEIVTWAVGDSSLTPLTNNSVEDEHPQIDGNRVVWEGEGGSDAGSDTEIFTWEVGESAATQVTEDGYNDESPQVSGDLVVWNGSDGSSSEIYAWQEGDFAPAKLIDDAYGDSGAQVSGDRIVWQHQDGSDGEIYMAAPAVTTRYQQSSSKITYLGTWKYKSTWAASGGSLYSTSDEGAAAIIEFTGTSIDVVARTTPWYGIADVWLDGFAVDPLDFYSPTIAYKQVVGSLSGLDDEAHTLVIKCTDNMNGSSSGNGISLDALDVAGTLDQAETTTRYQEGYADFTYTGTWPTTNTNWYQASGATYKTTDETGAALNIWFYGEYLCWVARTTPWYGQAVVVVDGGDPQTVDLWSSSVKPKQKVFDTGLMDLDTHEVSIYYRGAKHWSSWGTVVNVDAFDILGFPVGPADPATPILFTNRYQQSDSRITIMGNWKYKSTWAASGGSFYSTTQGGAAAVIQFTGTDITVRGRTTPWYGYARVTLDGVEQSPADFYSASILYKQPVVELTGLTNDAHILTIECAGTKNPSSTGHGISFDAVDVTGALEQAQTKTRVQQDGAGCEYTLGWSTAYPGWWKASGGSYATTSSDTASMHIEFEGSYVTLIAKTAPWYGHAIVYVDEGEPGQFWSVVDLYSPTQQYKQAVFNTGALTPGTHDINIYCNGSRNPSSLGTTICVDAFDILLTAP